MSDENFDRPEPMADFFDLRAEGYDEHMRGYVFTVDQFTAFYEAVALSFPVTEEPLTVLDLGCGTGLEIEFILRRVPNARITGVDLSTQMLDRLQQRYCDHMHQIRLVVGSYLTMPFDERGYDFVVSAMTIHHLLHDAKRALYKKIRAALKPDGRYIEGDGVTRADAEADFLATYVEQMAALPAAGDGDYHIDLPLSIETQKTLLLEAGFHSFELLWQKDSADLWNAAVYAVTA
ncbi:MAG: class I SAM-dependent methyltransferase [Caldilineaceae bacterium]|nr:class I SAM-dependent methyltransferase [Caldilineaceae bacterium]